MLTSGRQPEEVAMTWTSMWMATAVASADPELTDASADVAEITEDDARDIRWMIRAQIVAFKKGDWAGALALSSAGIQASFAEPGSLKALIEGNYRALVEPRQVVFGGFAIVPDGIALTVEVIDRSGERHHLLYMVTHERGRGWCIHGCLMTSVESLAEAA
jgi:hypothetical protein